MACPIAPPITSDDIRAEFGGTEKNFRLKDYYRGGDYVSMDVPNIPESGRISYYDFLGAENTSNGSMNFDVAGTYTFTIPQFRSMTVVMVGGSGGAGESCWDMQPQNIVGSGAPGTTGGNTEFLDCIASGGDYGRGSIGGGRYTATQPPKAANGTAYGPFFALVTGGGQPGGTGNLFFGSPTSRGGEGGDSAKIEFTITRAQAPTPGTKVTVKVGAKGKGGTVAGHGANGNDGLDGYVHLTWA